VDPLGALLLPSFGGAPGVTELPAGASDTLDELDGLTAGDIDGRKELKTGG
jgi:hypothetical protein